MTRFLLLIFMNDFYLDRGYSSAFFLFLFRRTKSINIYSLRLCVYLFHLYHFNYFLSDCLKNILNFISILSWSLVIGKAMALCEFLCLLTCHLSSLLLYQYCSFRSYLLPITTVCIFSWELFLTSNSHLFSLSKLSLLVMSKTKKAAIELL